MYMHKRDQETYLNPAFIISWKQTPVNRSRSFTLMKFHSAL